MPAQTQSESTNSSVNIIIKGVAICYQKDYLWKIIFPFDDKHQIKFSSQKDGGAMTAARPLAKAKNTIEIISDGAISTAAADVNFAATFDLTASFVHKNGLRQKPDWNEQAVLMSVQNALVSSENISKFDFDLTENNHFKRHLGKIPSSSRAVIELGADGQLSVKSEGKEVFATEPGHSYKLLFDNDCPEETIESGQNDFDMFYQIIEDMNDPQLRFRIVAAATSPLDDSQLAQTFSSTGRKPCQSVRVSLAENLP